jgi:hypothetical protein
MYRLNTDFQLFLWKISTHVQIVTNNIVTRAKQYSLINAYYDFYEILLEFRLSPTNKIVLNL